MDADQAFEGRLRDNRAKAVTVAILLFIVGSVGIALLPSGDPVEKRSVSVSPSPTSSPIPSPSTPPLRVASNAPTALPLSGEIDPGRYFVAWPDRPIREANTGEVVPGIYLTLPAGWRLTEEGSIPPRPTVTKDFLRLSLFQDVTHVVADVCARNADLEFVAVGSTARDLRVALRNQVGIDRSGPADVLVGYYPASKYVLRHPRECPGPEGDQIWAGGPPDSGFSILTGGVGTIYVADVNAHRLVVTSDYRFATEAALTELDAIIASIDIAPPPFEQDQGLRYSMTVDGIPLSLSVPTGGWERVGGTSINKSVRGPQRAEGMIYWTTFPDAVDTYTCARQLKPSIGPSTADLAAAVANAPGTQLIAGPADVRLDGRATKYIVLAVREDRGCDPGFFFTWRDRQGGAMWSATEPGDTIRVWIVDLDGTRLFIAGGTKPDAGPELEQEIEQIVRSIWFA